MTVNLHNNEILQDLNYWYDPVGNITELQDHAQQTLFFNNSVVSPTQAFIYDALYRLIEASGRELIGTATFGTDDNWNDAAWQTTHKGNGNAVQNYPCWRTPVACACIISQDLHIFITSVDLRSILKV